MSKNTPLEPVFVKSLLLLVGSLILTLFVLFPRASTVSPVTVAVVLPAEKVVKSGARQEVQTAPSSWDATIPSVVATQPAATYPGTTKASSIEADLLHAGMLADEGNIRGAVEALEEILKVDPKNEQALSQMGQMQYLDLQAPDLAIQYFQRAIAVNPDNQLVMADLLGLWESEGKAKEGVAFLSKIEKQGASSPEVAQALAQMLSATGRDKEAAAYYARAMQARDIKASLKVDEAKSLAASGDSIKAVGAFDESITNQELNIAEKTMHGQSAAAEQERLNQTKLAKIEALIKLKSFDQAWAMLEEMKASMPNNGAILTLIETINQQRAG